MDRNNVAIGLFSLRISVFLVMAIWAIDKILNPVHTIKFFESFYFIKGLSVSMAFIIGCSQLLILAGFIFGIKKKWTYGAVFVMHAISTIASFKMFLSPLASPNILFWTDFPMLAACFSLYILRHEDVLYTF